jgi:hypothetical protein
VNDETVESHFHFPNKLQRLTKMILSKLLFFSLPVMAAASTAHQYEQYNLRRKAKAAKVSKSVRL